MLPAESKRIFKEIIAFSLGLYVFGLLFWIVSNAMDQPKTEEDYFTRVGIELTLWENALIAILFWSAWRISGKLEQVNYWKIAVATLAILFVYYHLVYVFNWIDYYLVEGHPFEEEKMGLKELLALFDRNTRSAPRYDLVFYFSKIFQDLRYVNQIGGYIMVFFEFLYGHLTMPLWISAIAYVVRRKLTVGNGKIPELIS